MNLQYISDNNGKTTGVFIPISEWNQLKRKYEGLDDESFTIPDWQVNEARRRLANFHANEDSAVDIDEALDEIDNSL